MSFYSDKNKANKFSHFLDFNKMESSQMFSNSSKQLQYFPNYNKNDNFYKLPFFPYRRGEEYIRDPNIGGSLKVNYIPEKPKRCVTFSKRKKGIMKKAYELSRLTGSQVLVVISSENCRTYLYCTEAFNNFIKDHKHDLMNSLNSSQVYYNVEGEYNPFHIQNDYMNVCFCGKKNQI